MGAQANAAPVIIKRKKIIKGGGHHGGAWKVAYADFVTAMMAFFLLMWLLNATTEQQRKGLADYFTPTIPINRISGGGDGAFGGESIFTEVTMPKNGTGATALNPTKENKADGTDGDDGKEAETESFEALVAELMGRGGETMVMENLLEHIVTRITDEGLVIEVFSLERAQLFEAGTAEPTQLLDALATLIADISKMVVNDVAIGGHVRSVPVTLITNPVWDLSGSRGTRMRTLLETSGIDSARMQRVTGHADREPVVQDPMAIRNDRLEIVLLREGK